MEKATLRPEWFVTKNYRDLPSGFSRSPFRRKGFIIKTLHSISLFFSEAFFSEEYSKKKGMFQILDPRVKMISVLALIVSLTFIHNILLITSWYGFVIILALCSRIRLRFFLTRVWLFIPLFTAFIAIPALFNIFLPGDPLIVLKQFHAPLSIGPFHLPEQISITRQGTVSASLLILRVATSVSLIVLLILTTKWFQLLSALSLFRVSKSFVLILTITYRYIHLLLKAMEEMHQVFLSRILKKPSWKSSIRFTASGIYAILKKSLQTGEQVYAAMRSKGYSGKINLMESFHLSWFDILFIFGIGLWIIGSFYLISFA